MYILSIIPYLLLLVIKYKICYTTLRLTFCPSSNYEKGVENPRPHGRLGFGRGGASPSQEGNGAEAGDRPIPQVCKRGMAEAYSGRQTAGLRRAPEHPLPGNRQSVKGPCK